MHITLKNIGRRFNKEWIFKGLDYSFEAGNSYAILGPNGSGKSTLLNILMASLSPSEGAIAYQTDKEIIPEQVFSYISFAGPYLDLIEEFTLAETIAFHFSFKNYVEGFNAEGVLDLLALIGAKDKPLKYFSSGMKQRTKLALAFCSDTPMLVLDEPTSNLDVQGTDWYLSLIEKFTANKLVVLGSNQQHEYDFCKEQIQIMAYKSKPKMV
ncbi:ABC transporter ATP-binding protein [Pedobacter montanisoli]|uniref:ATP-binding cassette domain-containing protein n=1 Tax=Pedobacter montanisoli TaxID=2923277 RepID=A0ABS9ZT44_9SPHI|nr:ATP-binding cassette domain-containing protein [Pedobacter montanisoli]MCJ0741765.1 ATP-binding cassette domain-containing protein [Pedobacter montanisoli]